MAIYHIKKYGPTDPAPPPDAQAQQPFWREKHAWQTRDLDFAEIEAINQRHGPEAEPDEELSPIRPFRRHWVSWTLALLAILAMAAYGGISLAGQGFDFQILKRSAQLAQNQALADLRQAVVVVECKGSSGSGFNIDEAGLIVTNRHVVESGGDITVTFSGEAGGQTFVSRDCVLLDSVDLALVAINGAKLPTVSLSGVLPEAGEGVIFIGNPLGYDWTISEGISGGLVLIGLTPILYLSGPVHPGSSGSPVFNDRGQAVAVIFATVSGEEDSGLAIPISYLLSYLAENQ